MSTSTTKIACNSYETEYNNIINFINYDGQIRTSNPIEQCKRKTTAKVLKYENCKPTYKNI